MSARAMKTFSSGDFHYVYGEVYAPLQVDTDGETMAAEDIRKSAHEIDDDVPDCENCKRQSVALTGDEREAIRLWCLCDVHARNYVGMAGIPTYINIDSVLRLCELSGYGIEMAELVLLLDKIAYPIKYPPRDAKK